MSNCAVAISENRILLHQGRDFNLLRRCIQQQIDSEKQTVDQYCLDIAIPNQKRIEPDMPNTDEYSPKYKLSSPKRNNKPKQQSGVDQAKIVIDNLGVKVMKEDIMSKCNVCNYRGFVIISGTQMIDLVMNIQTGKVDSAREKYIDDWSIVHRQSRTDSTGKIKPGHFGKFLEQLMKKRGVMVDSEENQLNSTAKSNPGGKVKTLDLLGDSSGSDDECPVPKAKSSVETTNQPRPEMIIQEDGCLYLDTVLLQSAESTKWQEPRIQKIQNCPDVGKFEAVLKTCIKGEDFACGTPGREDNGMTQFYLCPECGSVFWDGGHQVSTLEKFNDFI